MPERRKLLIIGQTGQLARALKLQLSRGPNVALFLDRGACDLSAKPEVLRGVLEPHKTVDAIIIAAAYTQVDAAENDVDTAMSVNGCAPEIIAAFAAQHSIALVHISTDYVFNGRASIAYKADHPVDPINVYGHTKAKGEAGVLGASARAAVLRSSWVYDTAGQNFLTTMLRLGQRRAALDVVADQIGRPTYAPHLAKAALDFAEGLIQRDKSFEGLFHVSGGGTAASWADFAREIFSVFSAHLPHSVSVHNIEAKDFQAGTKAKAARPAYSILDLTKTEQVLGYALPDWREGVKAAYMDMKRLEHE